MFAISGIEHGKALNDILQEDLKHLSATGITIDWHCLGGSKMSNKSILKSMRMTPELFSYIDGYQGNGFNEKFENIILDAMFSDTSRRKRISELDALIRSKEEEYFQLVKKVQEFEALYHSSISIFKMLRGLSEHLQAHVSHMPELHFPDEESS